MPKESKKFALKLGIQTYKILTKDDEVCIPSLFSIFLAVKAKKNIGKNFKKIWTQIPII